MNMGLQISFKTLLLVLSGMSLDVALLGHAVILCLAF